jgi:predicted transcriptional regulator
MKKIVISINPEHVKNILNGTKKFEYRTKTAKGDINKILIYETTPVKRIVAEVEIIDVLMMSPNELWNETKQYSGISKAFFDNYFKNRKVAYAYKLGEVKEYKEPKKLEDFGLKFAPQSFVYVN